MTGVHSNHVPPNSSELEQMLKEAGYSSWNEADEFLRHHYHPSLSQFLRETWIILKHKGGSWNCSESVQPPPRLRFFFTSQDALFFATVLLAAAVLVQLRTKITPKITQCAIRYGLKAREAAKTPECVWKGFSHGILWLVSLYIIVLSGRYSFFRDPTTVWNGIMWNAHLDQEPIPSDLRFIYGLQLMHYFHALYATLRFEMKRADYMATLVHHFVTISLLICSFSMRFFRIGALVLLLHDISDVLLEVTKLNVYCRTRHGKKCLLNKYLGDLGFIAFTISWALCRLYWYPVKVLHACGWFAVFRHGCVDPNIFWPFNGLLWTLQILHIYWFTFILLLVYKIVTGQVHEVEDTRENEAELEPVNGSCSSSLSLTNGVCEKNGFIQHGKNDHGPAGDTVRSRRDNR